MISSQKRLNPVGVVNERFVHDVETKLRYLNPTNQKDISPLHPPPLPHLFTHYQPINLPNSVRVYFTSHLASLFGSVSHPNHNQQQATNAKEEPAQIQHVTLFHVFSLISTALSKNIEIHHALFILALVLKIIDTPTLMECFASATSPLPIILPYIPFILRTASILPNSVQLKAYDLSICSSYVMNLLLSPLSELSFTSKVMFPRLKANYNSMITTDIDGQLSLFFSPSFSNYVHYLVNPITFALSLSLASQSLDNLQLFVAIITSIFLHNSYSLSSKAPSTQNEHLFSLELQHLSALSSILVGFMNQIQIVGSSALSLLPSSLIFHFLTSLAICNRDSLRDISHIAPKSVQTMVDIIYTSIADHAHSTLFSLFFELMDVADSKDTLMPSLPPSLSHSPSATPPIATPPQNLSATVSPRSSLTQTAAPKAASGRASPSSTPRPQSRQSLAATTAPAPPAKPAPVPQAFSIMNVTNITKISPILASFLLQPASYKEYTGMVMTLYSELISTSEFSPAQTPFLLQLFSHLLFFLFPNPAAFTELPPHQAPALPSLSAIIADVAPLSFTYPSSSNPFFFDRTEEHPSALLIARSNPPVPTPSASLATPKKGSRSKAVSLSLGESTAPSSGARASHSLLPPLANPHQKNTHSSHCFLSSCRSQAGHLILTMLSHPKFRASLPLSMFSSKLEASTNPSILTIITNSLVWKNMSDATLLPQFIFSDHNPLASDDDGSDQYSSAKKLEYSAKQQKKEQFGDEWPSVGTDEEKIANLFPTLVISSQLALHLCRTGITPQQIKPEFHNKPQWEPPPFPSDNPKSGRAAFTPLSLPFLRYSVYFETLAILLERTIVAESDSAPVRSRKEKTRIALLQFIWSSILSQPKFTAHEEKVESAGHSRHGLTPLDGTTLAKLYVVGDPDRMLVLPTLHAIRVFFIASNALKTELSNMVKGCIYSICTLISFPSEHIKQVVTPSEDSQFIFFHRAATELLLSFFLGGDEILDPDATGSNWVLDIMRVELPLIQHSSLLTLIELGKRRPPEKFNEFWEPIFKQLLTKEQISKYTELDRSYAASLLSLFTRTCRSFDQIHNQLSSIINLLTLPSAPLQGAVFSLLISIAKRGERERGILISLRAHEWVAAGLRSEPDEIIFSSLQFFIIFLSSIYQSGQRGERAKGNNWVTYRDVKFRRECDKIIAMLFPICFYELLSLLSASTPLVSSVMPTHSRRVVALAAACISCFAEAGFGAAELLATESPSKSIKETGKYPCIRLMLSVFQSDGDPDLSKQESIQFLNDTKLSAPVSVARALSLFSRIDARVASVITQIVVEQMTNPSFSLTLKLLVQTERGANLANILRFISRMCSTKNRFRKICFSSGMMPLLLQIVSEPENWVFTEAEAMRQTLPKQRSHHSQSRSPLSLHSTTSTFPVPSGSPQLSAAAMLETEDPVSTLAKFSVPSSAWDDKPDSAFNRLFGKKEKEEEAEDGEAEPEEVPEIPENPEEDAIDQDAMMFDHEALHQLNTSMLRERERAEKEEEPESSTQSSLNPLPTAKWILLYAIKTIESMLDSTTIWPFLNYNPSKEENINDQTQGSLGTLLQKNHPWLLHKLQTEQYSAIQRALCKFMATLVSLTRLHPQPIPALPAPGATKAPPQLTPSPDDGRKGLAFLLLPPSADARFLPSLPPERPNPPLSFATQLLSESLTNHVNTLQSLIPYWQQLGASPPQTVVKGAEKHLTSLLDRERVLRELFEIYEQQNTKVTKEDLAEAIVRYPTFIPTCCTLFTSPLVSIHLRIAIAKLLVIVTDRYERLRIQIPEMCLSQITAISNISALAVANSPTVNALYIPCSRDAALYKRFYTLIRTDDNVAGVQHITEAMKRLSTCKESGAPEAYHQLYALQQALDRLYTPHGKYVVKEFAPVYRLCILCQLVSLNFSAGRGPFFRSDRVLYDIAFHSCSDEQSLMVKVLGGSAFVSTLSQKVPKTVIEAISFLVALHIMHNFSKRGFSFKQVRDFNLFPMYISLLRLPSPDSIVFDQNLSFMPNAEKCFLAASSIAHFCRTSAQNAQVVAEHPAFFPSILALLAVPAVRCESIMFTRPNHHLRLVLLFALFSVCTMHHAAILILITQYPSSFPIISSTLFTRRQHELSVYLVKDDPRLKVVPFASAYSPTVNLLKEGSLPSEQIFSSLSRIYALRLLSHMHIISFFNTMQLTGTVPRPQFEPAVLSSPHLHFFTKERTISRAHSLLSQNPSSTQSSSLQTANLTIEALRFCRVMDSLDSGTFSNKSSQPVLAFQLPKEHWPREPLSTAPFVNESQFGTLIQKGPRNQFNIHPDTLKQLPRFSPNVAYPQTYSNDPSKKNDTVMSYKDYEPYLNRRVQNYRLFINTLDKWLVQARQMKQSPNLDSLTWNILYRLTLDCENSEMLRTLLDLAQLPVDAGDQANQSKSRDGIELICNILTTAGATLEVLQVASDLMVMFAEGKGDKSTSLINYQDSTFYTRSDFHRKKIEVYAMVKIINLLSSPIPELKLNASRILLSLTDHNLGTIALDDPKAVATIASAVAEEDGELLDNLIWVIANAARINPRLKKQFCEHQIITQLVSKLEPLRTGSRGSNSVRPFVAAIACCVSNLVDHSSDNAREFFHSGGLELFLTIASRTQEVERTTMFFLLSAVRNSSRRLVEGDWKLLSHSVQSLNVSLLVQNVVSILVTMPPTTQEVDDAECNILSRAKSFDMLKTHFETIAVPDRLSVDWDYVKRNPNSPVCVILTHNATGSLEFGEEEETNISEQVVEREEDNETEKKGLFKPLVGRTASLNSAYSVRAGLLDLLEETLFNFSFFSSLTKTMAPVPPPAPSESFPYALEDVTKTRTAVFQSPFDVGKTM
ncbi:hypothetical protein BLNAU_16028 [Blattamonas nauphoetae]|uniref:Uncharacterized protein n=1 Tax=Blattamonas nauphoetae TaxID=2049346 RepID=A0ABQ9X8W5_9EUKA|nr:hypothetical protein BLNAU_16028 [Blattamonas nauphoetae]